MGITRRPGGHDAGATPRYVKLMTTKATTGRPAQVGQIGQAFETLSVETRGPGLSDQTSAVRAWLDRIGAGDGLLTLFIRHTSASLLIQENADPDVHEDLLDALERLAPRDHAYVHDVEGPDDMPAHIKASLLGPSLTLPVSGGRLAVGTWQGIYLCEHRDHGGSRSLILTLNGE
jgi:secondary thiamine-phosphate synthase enzyme